MDPQSAGNLRRFVHWIREHRIWTHVHVSGIAVKLDGDWVTVWTRTVLADTPKVETPLAKPVVATEGVLAFRLAAPLSDLATLLSDARKGEVPANRLRRLDVPLKTWCPPGKKPGHLSFDRRLTASWLTNEVDDSEGWPRVESTWQGGQVSDWAANDLLKYEYLTRIEQLFKTQGYGTIAELGTKLGFRHHSSDFIHTSTKHSLSAPLLARLTSVEHDRERDVIVAIMETGTRLRRGLLRLRLVQSDGKPPRAAWRIPRSKGRFVSVEIPGPSEGGAQVSLSYEGLGEISSLTLSVRPRLRPWPRLSAISMIDPDLARIRKDVASKNPDEHERGTSLLLELMGYASFWWTRALAQPAASANGRHAQDVMAFSRSDDRCLVVECKTDWTKDSKINTLVGRANSMIERLKQDSADESPWTRALLVVSCPRHETPNAIRENLRLNRAGLLTVEDATELLDMMTKGFPEKEVLDRFEKVFALDEMPGVDFDQKL